MTILLIVMIFDYIVVCADAITDSGIIRPEYISRFWWHFFKALRYYMPQLIIFFLLYYFGLFKIKTWYVIGIIAYVEVGWILWKIIYYLKVLHRIGIK